MNFAIKLLPEAEGDIAEAIHWYNDRQTGLGPQFLHQVGECLSRIQDRPMTFPEVSGRVRRSLVKRFPYGIFFVVGDQSIVVLAVIHSRRDPRAWQERTIQ